MLARGSTSAMLLTAHTTPALNDKMDQRQKTTGKTAVNGQREHAERETLNEIKLIVQKLTGQGYIRNRYTALLYVRDWLRAVCEEPSSYPQFIQLVGTTLRKLPNPANSAFPGDSRNDDMSDRDHRSFSRAVELDLSPDPADSYRSLVQTRSHESPSSNDQETWESPATRLIPDGGFWVRDAQTAPPKRHIAAIAEGLHEEINPSLQNQRAQKGDYASAYRYLTADSRRSRVAEAVSVAYREELQGQARAMLFERQQRLAGRQASQTGTQRATGTTAASAFITKTQAHGEGYWKEEETFLPGSTNPYAAESGNDKDNVDYWRTWTQVATDEAYAGQQQQQQLQQQQQRFKMRASLTGQQQWANNVAHPYAAFTAGVSPKSYDTSLPSAGARRSPQLAGQAEHRPSVN